MGRYLETRIKYVSIRTILLKKIKDLFFEKNRKKLIGPKCGSVGYRMGRIGPKKARIDPKMVRIGPGLGTIRIFLYRIMKKNIYVKKTLCGESIPNFFI